MDTCEFQLWNRPMGSPCTMPEDEDERLSLPSTRATDWGREKIDTVEAQLALLTRQMHHLLQLQQQQKERLYYYYIYLFRSLLLEQHRSDHQYSLVIHLKTKVEALH